MITFDSIRLNTRESKPLISPAEWLKSHKNESIDPKRFMNSEVPANDVCNLSRVELLDEGTNALAAASANNDSDDGKA